MGGCCIRSRVAPLHHSAKNVDPGAERRHVYFDVFRLMDSDRDGKLSAAELRKAFAELGYKITAAQAVKMVHLADEDNDGMLDYKEFLTMAERRAVWSRPHAENGILSAFKAFDLNRDGMITKEELQRAMAKMGQPLTKKEAYEMLKTVDANGDGRISYREFMHAWRQFMSDTESTSL